MTFVCLLALLEGVFRVLAACAVEADLFPAWCSVASALHARLQRIAAVAVVFATELRVAAVAVAFAFAAELRVAAVAVAFAAIALPTDLHACLLQK